MNVRNEFRATTEPQILFPYLVNQVGSKCGCQQLC
jgi:hypothetical protein